MFRNFDFLRALLNVNLSEISIYIFHLYFIRVDRGGKMNSHLLISLFPIMKTNLQFP